VSYIILVNDASSGGGVENVLFSSMIYFLIVFILAKGIGRWHTCILTGGLSGLSIGGFVFGMIIFVWSKGVRMCNCVFIFIYETIKWCEVLMIESSFVKHSCLVCFFIALL